MGLSVSVTSRSSIETDKRIELVLSWELPSNPIDVYSCFYKEIRITPKIWLGAYRLLPAGTLCQTLDSQNIVNFVRQR